MRKKLLAILLAVCMVMSLAPAAFASATTVEVATLDALNSAFAEGKNAKLTADITYSGVYKYDGTQQIVKVETGNVSLDLNGYDIIQTNTNSGGLSAAAIKVAAGATLTVKDSSDPSTGEIKACNTAFQLEGTLNFQGGTIVIGEIHSGADVSAEYGFAYGVWIYIRNAATQYPTLNMSGGAIVLDSKDELAANGVDEYANAVDCGDSVYGITEIYDNAVINITDGTFDDNVVVSGNTSVTVPEGVEVYRVNADGSEFVAVAEVDGINYDTLTAAIAAAEDGDTITLLKDIEITESLDVSYNSDFDKIDVTIDGNGKTIKAVGDAWGSTWMVDVAWNVLLKNITIDGNNVVTRGLQFYTSESTLENVTIKNVTQGWGVAMQANASDLTLNGKLAFENCTASYIAAAVGNNLPEDTTCFVDASNVQATNVAIALEADSTAKASDSVTVYAEALIGDIYYGTLADANAAEGPFTEGYFTVDPSAYLA